MKLILCFALFLTFASLQAQYYPSDCTNAFEICNLGDYHFSNVKGFGKQENLNLDDLEIKETNSIWLKFAAENEGLLEFVIVPIDQGDDIDFVLYEGDVCSDFEPVRMMASGSIIGKESSLECLGQTGLRNSANDTHESKGCFDFDDNFLKPITLKQPKNYYLLINNFNSENGFNILFSGENGLKLADNCKKEISSVIDFEIYPNPAMDEISLRTETEIFGPIELVLFDMSGRIFKKKTYDSMIELKKLDVSNIPSGEYYLRIVSEEYTGLKSLVKI